MAAAAALVLALWVGSAQAQEVVRAAPGTLAPGVRPAGRGAQVAPGRESPRGPTGRPGRDVRRPPDVLAATRRVVAGGGAVRPRTATRARRGRAAASRTVSSDRQVAGLVLRKTDGAAPRRVVGDGVLRLVRALVGADAPSDGARPVRDRLALREQRPVDQSRTVMLPLAAGRF